MKYLRFSADYISPSVIDQKEGSTNSIALGLSDALEQRIADWNDRYQEIIPLGIQERSQESVASSISALDSEGIELARDIASEIEGGAKVEYYSEGLMKRIS